MFKSSYIMPGDILGAITVIQYSCDVRAYQYSNQPPMQAFLKPGEPNTCLGTRLVLNTKLLTSSWAGVGSAYICHVAQYIEGICSNLTK